MGKGGIVGLGMGEREEVVGLWRRKLARQSEKSESDGKSRCSSGVVPAMLQRYRYVIRQQVRPGTIPPSPILISNRRGYHMPDLAPREKLNLSSQEDYTSLQEEAWKLKAVVR